MVQCVGSKVRVLPGAHEPRGSREDCLHLSVGILSIHSHATGHLWSAGHLSTADGENLGGLEPQRMFGVSGRHHRLRQNTGGT
ncbi:hypothetical protein FKM82_020150 [Ascaphus truei]